MKTINAIVKVLTALAAVAGAVYIIATYGDKIVAWAKEIWEKISTVTVDVTATVDAAPEDTAPVGEEDFAAEEPAAEAPVEEPAQEPEAAEAAPIADEADFEG